MLQVQVEVEADVTTVFVANWSLITMITAVTPTGNNAAFSGANIVRGITVGGDTFGGDTLSCIFTRNDTKSDTRSDTRNDTRSDTTTKIADNSKPV